LTTMARSNRNLLAMVNTLLEVYRYEAGRKTLIFSPVNVGELLTEVVQELSPLADEKTLGLKLGIDKEVDSKVLGDRLELHRVFTNLIGNAIKFTEKGAVEIKLEAGNNNGSPTSSWAIINIKDTGPGIPPEEQHLLFERFRPGSHKRSGSGLGLHLSHRIVNAHQGQIEVKSEVGQGSNFKIYLPMQD